MSNSSKEIVGSKREGQQQQKLDLPNIYDNIQEALLGLRGALREFARWINQNHELQEIAVDAFPEFMRLVTIERELKVIAHSLPYYDQDIMKILMKKGWGKNNNRTEGDLSEMTYLVKKVRERQKNIVPDHL